MKAQTVATAVIQAGQRDRPPLKAVLLLALGLFVSWYIFIGSLDRSGDDPWYFPPLLIGSFGGIAYGGFLVLSRIIGLAHRLNQGAHQFHQSLELMRKHGVIPTFRRIMEGYETRIPRRPEGWRRL